MRKTFKEYLSVIYLTVIVAVIAFGFLFGPEELKGKMMIAGIIAAVTGIPALLINRSKEKEAGAQNSGNLELSDNAWASKIDYGYQKIKAITVKTVDEYMSQLTTERGAKLSWIKGDKETVSSKYYQYVNPSVVTVRVRANGEPLQAMFFIEGCKENSNNLPRGFVKKENGNIEVEPTEENVEVQDDCETKNISSISLDKSRKLQTNTEQLITERADFIPVDMLKKLKQLHEQGILDDEEFAEKKKQLLKL